MTFIVLALTLILATSVGAEQKKSFWERLFEPQHPKVVVPAKPHKHKKEQHREASPTPSPTPVAALTVAVDAQWMADYWLQAATYKYYIPEEAKVTFSDGKYNVPIVMYRHYEDMVKATKANLDP